MTMMMIPPLSSSSSFKRLDNNQLKNVPRRRIVLVYLSLFFAVEGGWHAAAAALAAPQLTIVKKNKRQPLSSTATSSSSSSAWLDGCKSALSSSMSAACVKTLLQPIDAIKTFQQYTYATSGDSISFANACRSIAARGYGQFYAGLGVTVIGAMPGVALYFGVYSYCKRQLLSHTSWGKSHPTLSVAISAAIGNSVASFSRVPYEVIKQQLQTGAYGGNTMKALSAICKSGKVLDLIFPKGGIAIQMVRDIPYAVVTLLSYETIQAAFRQRQKRQQHDNTPSSGGSSSNDRQRRRQQKILDFCVGGLAGGLGSWVTTPMDVVKTRLQTNSAAYGGSVLTCTRALLKEGGPAAFLRGSVPRLLHKVPANAFFFLFYEVFRRLLRVTEAVERSSSTSSTAPTSTNEHPSRQK